jgi:type I restriction enzyme M protein
MTSQPSSALVRKLWQYCNILRDDGLSYPDYVEQLTYLLFLKMSDESSIGPVPPEFGWPSFASLDSVQLHAHYSKSLETLGRYGGMLGLIFQNARNKIRDPAKLRLLVVDLIGQTRWTSLSDDLKGDAYEGLLEKNARDTKSGAGQYFTPRALIAAIVRCVDPRPGEVVCDPACGTGGFLLAAHKYVRESPATLSPAQERHLRMKAIRGVELVEEVARLAAMNLMLHGIGGDLDDQLPIKQADSLRAIPEDHVDVVLTNPPFGVRGSVTYSNDDKRVASEDLTYARPDFWVETANKQLNFLQHVWSLLRPGGRAAVVIPDNVLYESGAASTVRRRLLKDCNVHTLLRLPAGLFYAHGVKANVVFFDKGKGRYDGNLWVYDLRTDKSFSLKSKPLQDSDLEEFVSLYAPDDSLESRKESTDIWRWKCFTHEQLVVLPDCNLDLRWSLPDSFREDRPSRLDELSTLIAADLHRALSHIAKASGKNDADLL